MVIPKVARPERLEEPLESPSVPGYGAGRAVADAPAEEKGPGRLESLFQGEHLLLGAFLAGQNLWDH